MSFGNPPIILESRPWDTGTWVRPLVVPLEPELAQSTQLSEVYGSGIPRAPDNAKWSPRCLQRVTNGQQQTTMQLSYGGYPGRWLQYPKYT